MNKWLDNIAGDPASLRPTRLCATASRSGGRVLDAAGKKVCRNGLDGTGGFNTMYPVHSEPRLIGRSAAY